jgi:hypothetical protein
LAPRKALRKINPELILEGGLVLAKVPFVRWEDGEPHTGSEAQGIITSHGCSCEDYERAIQEGRSSAAKRKMLMVAPLKAAKVFRDKIDTIKSGTALDYFFIQGEPPWPADQVVDLTREQAIPASVLAGCKKVAQIEDWQWKALLIHIAISRFHQQPEDLFREDLLESRSPDAA